MRIRVDRDLCTGHALCVEQGPDLFVLDELGFNVTEERDVPTGQHEQARRGAQACPEGAISVEDDTKA